jgi:hypothetical protein
MYKSRLVFDAKPIKKPGNHAYLGLRLQIGCLILFAQSNKLPYFFPVGCVM